MTRIALLLFLLAPATAAAAGSAPAEGLPLMDLAVHAFNFTVLAIVLKWKVWPLVSEFLVNRSNEIRRQLSVAAEAQEAARAEYDRINQRLEGFEAELGLLLENVRAEGARQHEAAIERANATATAMVEAAQKSVSDELLQARNALRREAIDLAVGFAEQQIRNQLTDDQQGVLVEQVLNRVERDGASQEATGE